MLQDVWGYSAEVTTRTVDTHIKRLRNKLGSMGKYVQTIRGVGYKFEEEIFDESVSAISATKIREQLRSEGKLD